MTIKLTSPIGMHITLKLRCHYDFTTTANFRKNDVSLAKSQYVNDKSFVG